MKLRIPNSKYHSWYLWQISQQIMLLPTLIKSKMATMFSADVTVLQRRHHPKNIPHISCREDQRLPTEGKIVSKYCNTSKLKRRSSINTLPSFPRPMYYCGDMILRVRRSKWNAANTSTTLRQEPLGQYQFHKKKKILFAIHFGSCQYHSWDPNCKLLLSFFLSLTISPRHKKWSGVQIKPIV